VKVILQNNSKHPSHPLLPLHRRLHVILSFFALSLLLLSGCDQLPEDPHAYPLQFKVIQEIESGVSCALSVPGADGSDDLLFEAHFHSPKGDRFIQITDLGATQVLHHHGLWNSTEVPASVDLPGYRWQGAFAGEITSPGIGGYYHLTTDTSLRIIRFSWEGFRQDTILVRYRPDQDFGINWDISCGGVFRLDLTGTDPPEGWSYINYGYYPAPRELILWEDLDPPVVRSIFHSGSVLRHFGASDLDNDGDEELLWGTNAPCNGITHNGIADTTAYYIALRQDGEPLWITPTISGGGSAYLYPDPKEPALFGLRQLRNFNAGGTRQLVHELDPKTGRILRELELRGFAICAMIDPERWILHFDPSSEILQWWTRDFSVARSLVCEAGIFGLAKGAAIEEDLEQIFLASLLDRDFIYLNGELEIIARSGFRLLEGAPEFHFYRDGEKQTAYLARFPGGPELIVQPYFSPWWQWWTWRYRWPLIWGLAIPAALIGLYSLIRYLRLRRLARLAEAEAKRKLEIAYAQRGALLERLHNAQETERTRLARELHDDLGQTLTLQKMDLYELSDQVPGHEKTLNDMIIRADTALTSMRHLIADLRPAVLDELGLAGALAWLVEYMQTDSGPRLSFQWEESTLDLGLEFKTVLFRVCQEALTNVLRHAQATEAVVRIELEEGLLKLTISDDGVGMSPPEQHRPGSLGLLGMRERLAPWNGEVEIESQPGQGTTVKVRLPLGGV